MYFYHGYALGVASTISGSEFTEAVCALSVNGGKSTASKSATPPPAGISFSSANSSIEGRNSLRSGLPVWVTEGSVLIEDLNIRGQFSAGRIEAHLYAEDRAGDYEGSVVITGSKFDDVKIAGHSVQIETSKDLIVRYPTYESMQTAFQNTFSRDEVLGCLVGRDLGKGNATTWDLQAAYEGYREQKDLTKLKSLVLCSFVSKVTVGGGFNTWGPIISVPNFGNIYLGEVLVWPWMRCLNMFRIELESGGAVSGGSTGYGGNTWP